MGETVVLLETALDGVFSLMDGGVKSLGIGEVVDEVEGDGLDLLVVVCCCDDADVERVLF